MTDATIITIVAAIPATIAAIGALIVSVGNARNAREIIAKVDDNTVKTQEVNAKADVIHTLTNDSLSKATGALAVANETIAGLEKLNLALMAKQVPQLKARK